MNWKILGVMFWLGCVIQGNALAAVRLAIIPESAAAQNAADVLTATLSAIDQVQLVERTELNRVLGEQAAAMSGKDFLKLGQIVGADGVLLLGLSVEGTNQWLDLRLMAVKAGVGLRQLSQEWPPGDVRGWSQELALRLVPWWPKLTVLKKDAVPISILNLRSAVRSTEAEQLERELTTLLHHRLMQQPEVFVLERRRLELLADEKDFNGDVSAFWAGGYLLEGVINKERFDADVVTISGRIVPPDKENPTVIELTGARTNLPALIDDLSRRVLAAVKKGATLRAWNPNEEAAQYWDEARWAAKWRMWREAQSSSEASWALGRQTKEVAELRVRAWRETGLDRARCTFERKTVQVNYSAPPDVNRFADLRRAADLFEAGWRRFVADESPLDAQWFDLGIGLAGDLSAWLRHFYFMVEARVGQEEQIKQAQQQADRICRIFLAHPGYAKATGRRSLATTRALWGSLWVNTPEQGLNLYREILDAGEWPLVRQRFLNVGCFDQEGATRRVNGWPEGYYDPASPLLTGWKWDDRERWPRVWRQFVDELCASTNSLMALEGHYLRCSFAWRNDDYERELQELLKFVWEQREAVVAANMSVGLLTDLRKLAGNWSTSESTDSRTAALAPERRQRIESELWPGFETKFAGVSRAQAEKEKRLKLIAEAKTYFSTRSDYDFGSFVRWQREKYSEAEAQELLPVVQSYKKRLFELPLGTLRGMAWSNSVTRFEAALQSAASGAQQTNPVAKTNPATKSAGTITNQMRSPVPPNAAGGISRAGLGLPFGEVNAAQPVVAPQTIGATNYFRAAKFWRPDHKQLGSEQQDTFIITDAIFREGKIWAEVLFRDVTQYNYEQSHRAVICGIVPDTLATEIIHVELDQGAVPEAFRSRTGERHFEVFRNAVYFNVGGKVRRYSLPARKWEAVSVPVEGAVKMDLVQDRLYLRTSDSIMVLSTNDAGADIVASKRRRPAQKVLDEIENLGASAIFSGPTGGVCVAVGNKMWAYSTTKNDWELVMQFPVTDAGYDSRGITYKITPEFQDEQIYGWFAGNPAPELLLTQPPDPRLGRRETLGRPPQAPSLPKARWKLAARVRPVTGVTALESNRLWSFVGKLVVQSDGGQPVLMQENGRQGLLFGFDLSGKTPVIVPLQLEVPRDLVSGEELNQLVGSGAFGNTLFRATPPGLILTHYHLPGFWLLPRQELERQMRAWSENQPLITYPAPTNANASLRAL